MQIYYFKMSFLLVSFTVVCLFYTLGAEECGIPKPVRKLSLGRIMGGVKAVEGAWPWMVAIRLQTNRGELPWCTGFLVDRMHVVTAAHCFNNNITNPTLFSVKIGANDITKAMTFSVKSITIHENYMQGAFDDDVAIMTLSDAVTLDTFAPICLPAGPLLEKSFDGETATVAGWGVLYPNGPAPDTLYVLESLPFIDKDTCSKIFGDPMYRKSLPEGITKKHICAGFLEGGKDTCKIDSGGALMYKYEGRWYAVGITSFGYFCGKEGFPGGYARVSTYLDWIYNVIAQN